MPIYEYSCGDCGARFEKMVRFMESGRKQECPSCKSLNTQKEISIFASPGSSGDASGPSSDSCNSRGGFT